VLSVDPDNTLATQALRELEGERTRRAARAGRPAVLARVDRATPARGAVEPASANERRELEYGSLLLRQGEYAASIRSFETYLKSHPKDDLGRRYLSDAHFQLGQQRLQQGRKEEAVLHLESASRLRGSDAPEINGTLTALRKSLAEEYYQQGVRTQASDIRQAIALLERAVRYDPAHVNATARLQQARQMEKNLRMIEEAPKAR
jgi:tetratricopeptide (TPR) repeat protein